MKWIFPRSVPVQSEMKESEFPAWRSQGAIDKREDKRHVQVRIIGRDGEHGRFNWNFEDRSLDTWGADGAYVAGQQAIVFAFA